MYDLIIIGSGPAGLNASIYASRYKIKHLVIGAEMGGQAAKASDVQNWGGFKSITGAELTQKFREQAENLGAEIVQAKVDRIEKKGDIFEVSCGEIDKKFEAKYLILALGMKPRMLNVPGEEKLIGKGVSYCSICDAAFFRGKDVAVIGGGDSAATAALHLSEFANSVSLHYPEQGLKMEPAWQEKIGENPKIKMEKCQGVLEIKGDNKVEGLVCKMDGEKIETKVSGIFIEIGSVPGVGLAKELGVAVDTEDYIIVKDDQSTNVERIFAAGDVTTGSNKFRQMITAAAEGAIAAGSVYQKIKMGK
jgi:thioredoxin reductase (NADPH)